MVKRDLSLREALLGKENWRATWFAIVYMVNVQIAGVNAVTLFSTDIIADISDSISPNIGAIIVNSLSFISAIFCFFTLSYFKRRTLLLYTRFIDSAQMLLLGFSIFYGYDSPTMIFIFGIIIV